MTSPHFPAPCEVRYHPGFFWLFHKSSRQGTEPVAPHSRIVINGGRKQKQTTQDFRPTKRQGIWRANHMAYTTGMPASQASQQWVLHRRKQVGCLCTAMVKHFLIYLWTATMKFSNFNFLYRKPAVTEQYYFVHDTKKENLSTCVWKKECYILWQPQNILLSPQVSFPICLYCSQPASQRLQVWPFWPREHADAHDLSTPDGVTRTALNSSMWHLAAIQHTNRPTITREWCVCVHMCVCVCGKDEHLESRFKSTPLLQEVSEQ